MNKFQPVYMYFVAEKYDGAINKRTSSIKLNYVSMKCHVESGMKYNFKEQL